MGKKYILMKSLSQSPKKDGKWFTKESYARQYADTHHYDDAVILKVIDYTSPPRGSITEDLI